MFFNPDLLLVALFLIRNTVGLTLVVFLAREVWPILRQRMILNGKEQQARLIDLVAQAAVSQAEQLYHSNEEKKKAATSFLERELTAIGIPIDPIRADEWFTEKGTICKQPIRSSTIGNRPLKLVVRRT